jgi:hypothetical protein
MHLLVVGPCSFMPYYRQQLKAARNKTALAGRISTLFLSVYRGHIAPEALVPDVSGVFEDLESQVDESVSRSAAAGDRAAIDAEQLSRSPYLTQGIIDELFLLVHETTVGDWSFRLYRGRS